jgi:CheY-like chemotaxis protein
MSKSSVILIVDDEEDDRLLLELALRRAGITSRVCPLPDGQDAINYLAGTGVYANRETYPLPVLVFTDFTMPRRNAMQLLKWIRERPELGSLPVVVLVGSASQNEIQVALAAGASASFNKPVEFARLVEEVKAVGQKFLSEDEQKADATKSQKG